MKKNGKKKTMFFCTRWKSFAVVKLILLFVILGFCFEVLDTERTLVS
jgi:hypothetical protein